MQFRNMSQSLLNVQIFHQNHLYILQSLSETK